MSMTTKITGVRDLDQDFAKMMQVKLSCEAAGISYPQEVKEYFNDPNDSEDDLRREMETVSITDAVSICNQDMVDGFEVDLSRLPKDVKAIRFEIRY